MIFSSLLRIGLVCFPGYVIATDLILAHDQAKVVKNSYIIRLKTDHSRGNTATAVAGSISTSCLSMLFFLLVSLSYYTTTIESLSLSMSSSPTPMKVLVVGGNGRVGGSAARHVHILLSEQQRKTNEEDESDQPKPTVELVLGGRNLQSFESSKSRILSQLTSTNSKRPSPLPPITFQNLNLDSPVAELTQTLTQLQPSVVIHTAGPFQRRTDVNLLQACLEASIPCVDVCDEPALCEKSRRLDPTAQANGVRAVTAAGIWPGTSSLMVTEAVAALSERYYQRNLTKSPPPPVDVEMSFFTAGTGNAGATIVSATFLLLCQAALTIVNSRKVDMEPWTSARDVDFRGKEGVRTVRLLDNPDVFTIYESGLAKKKTEEGENHAEIRSLSSRFATAPGVWNQLFGAMKTLVPKPILSNTDLMQKLSLFSLPIIRVVDGLVGATNAMRVDVTMEEEEEEHNEKGETKIVHRRSRCTFVVTHDDLEQCVGLATAAFALELMEGQEDVTKEEGGMTLEPGVYYPAELPKGTRERILERVKKDAIRWDFDIEETRQM